MKKTPVMCLLLAFIITSCSHHESADKKSVEIIKLYEAFENRESITINDISTSFEYVKLETKDECPLHPFHPCAIPMVH